VIRIHDECSRGQVFVVGTGAADGSQHHGECEGGTRTAGQGTYRRTINPLRLAGQEWSPLEIHVIWETSETGIQQNPWFRRLIFPEKSVQDEQIDSHCSAALRMNLAVCVRGEVLFSLVLAIFLPTLSGGIGRE
jgi:hypothetical protein